MPYDYATALDHIREATKTYHQAVDAAAAVIGAAELSLQEIGCAVVQWLTLLDDYGEPASLRLGWARYPVRSRKFRFVVAAVPPDDYAVDYRYVRAWSEVSAADKLATFERLPEFLFELNAAVLGRTTEAEKTVRMVTETLTAARKS